MSARPSLKRNTALNVAGAVIPLLVAIVTVPLYLNSIGAARYGVLSLVWLFTGYFNLLDFGISRATVNMVARWDATDVHGQRSVMWSALWISASLGLVGMCLAYPIASYVFSLVRFDDPHLRTEVVAALGWLCLVVPLMLLGGVLHGGLEARERFGVANALGVFGGLAIQLVPVVVAYQLSTRLDVLIASVVLTRLVLFLLAATVVARSFPLGRPMRWDADVVRRLIVFGSWASVSGIISPVLEALDRFVIGAKLSAADVATYAIPFSIADKLRIVPRALVRAAYPRLCSLPPDAARRLYQQLVTASMNLMTPLVLMGMLACKHLLLLWIGVPLDDVAGVVGIVLLCGAWFNSMSLVPFVLLQAQGRPNVTATIHAIEFVPFVLVLVGLVSAFGVVGAALAWAGRMAADCLLMCLAARRDNAGVMLPLVLHAAALVVVGLFAARHVFGWVDLIAALAVLGGAGLVLNRALIRDLLSRRGWKVAA